MTTAIKGEINNGDVNNNFDIDIELEEGLNELINSPLYKDVNKKMDELVVSGASSSFSFDKINK